MFLPTAVAVWPALLPGGLPLTYTLGTVSSSFGLAELHTGVPPDPGYDLQSANLTPSPPSSSSSTPPVIMPSWPPSTSQDEDADLRWSIPPPPPPIPPGSPTISQEPS